MLFIDLFSPWVNGREKAIESNWRDLEKFNQVQKGQLDNFEALATSDPRINMAYDNASLLNDKAQNSWMDTEVNTKAFPGRLAASAAQSDATRNVAVPLSNKRADNALGSENLTGDQITYQRGLTANKIRELNNNNTVKRQAVNNITVNGQTYDPNGFVGDILATTPGQNPTGDALAPKATATPEAAATPEATEQPPPPMEKSGTVQGMDFPGVDFDSMAIGDKIRATAADSYGGWSGENYITREADGSYSYIMTGLDNKGNKWAQRYIVNR